ncbi:MAG: NAD(P)-dependent oxidoreductase [Candidatus Doudnabacteria bacterium]|nr:NAD(P)-dependent oxidoreductase [Candidatus Doudnabacteria bacterium]
MKLLLTGAGGFIGKNLIQSDLAKKHQIIAPSRLQLDLMDEKALKEFFFRNQVDCVIHAAGKPGHRNAKDPSNIFYSDTRMFLNLLQNSDRYKKMIVLSSGAVYDQRFAIDKVKESDYKLRLPADEHALFRRVSADYIGRSDKIVELRIFGIFGPYEDYAIRFISNAICKCLFNLPITIKQNRMFDYIYVKDLPGILENILQTSDMSGAYNLTPDEPIELLQLAEMVKNLSDKNVPIIVQKSGMGPEYSGNNEKIKRDINYNLRPLPEAVEELYKWYKENFSTLDQTKLLTDK